MIAKYLFVALNIFFVLQIENVLSGKNTSTSSSSSTDRQILDELKKSFDTGEEVPTTDGYSSPVTKRTAETVLKHLKDILTNPTSGELIRRVATNARIVVTSEVGQKNILNVARTIMQMVRDPNHRDLYAAFCDMVIAIIEDEATGKKVARTGVETLGRALTHPNVLPATEGFVTGINIFLTGWTPEQMKAGIAKMAKVMSTYSAFRKTKETATSAYSKMRPSSPGSSSGTKTTNNVRSLFLESIESPRSSIHEASLSAMSHF